MPFIVAKNSMDPIKSLSDCNPCFMNIATLGKACVKNSGLIGGDLLFFEGNAFSVLLFSILS